MIEQILKKYESLLTDIDRKCDEVYKNLPRIPCRPSCADKTVCCKQIFPLSFIEAYYISLGFKKLDRNIRRELEREAKKLSKIIDKAFSGKNISRVYINTDYDAHNASQKKITRTLLDLKINCPFLSNSLCLIYPRRNFDCRLHGFAYDKNTNEILGCHRHAEIYKNLEFAKHALPNNYLYKEKISLDSEIISYLAENNIYKFARYLASPFTPILKDYSSFDWREFFNEKIPPEKIIPSTYSIIFD